MSSPPAAGVNRLRPVLIVWGVLAAVLAIKSFLTPTRHTVFTHYYAAGAAWRAGASSTGSIDGDLVYFQYGPIFSAALSALTRLPIGVASAGWTVASILFLLIGVRRLSAALPEALTPRRREWLMLILLAGCGSHSLQNGQVNLLIVGSFALGFAGVARQRWHWAGVWLTAPMLVKIYLIVVPATLVVLFPRRLLASTLLTLGAGLGLPWLLQSPSMVLDCHRRWWEFLSAGRHYEFDLAVQDFRSLLCVWGCPIDPKAFMPVQALTGLALLLGLAWRQRFGAISHHCLVWSSYVGLMHWLILFGPATENATYLLLAPAVSWLLVRPTTDRRDQLGWGCCLVGYVLMGPLQTSLFGNAARHWCAGQQLAPMGAALTLLGSWHLDGRGGRRHESPLANRYNKEGHTN